MTVNTIGKMKGFYINAASTRLLQISKKDKYEYNNQIFPNNSRIHIRARDYASLHRCLSPMMGSKLLKWDCIFNCCYEYPVMKEPDL